jgi:hypothetical protein
MKKSILSFKAFINEELALVGPPGGPGMPQMAMPPGVMPPPGMPSKKGKGGKKGMPPPEDPLKPLPYQGFTHTPETEAEIRELITLDYDNPNTLETEQPENASWQTLNTSQGNAYTREVMRLKGLHGMR